MGVVLNRERVAENRKINKVSVPVKVDPKRERLEITMTQQPDLSWTISFGTSATVFPATNAEIELHLQKLELQEKLAKYEEQFGKP
jgi:hypothetical protein